MEGRFGNKHFCHKLKGQKRRKKSQNPEKRVFVTILNTMKKNGNRIQFRVTFLPKKRVEKEKKTRK